ncbi:MAG TPA: phage holin family protein [Azospirillum sp.]|nr:phage holin family protein [Azospirillum sp.]
MSAAEDRDYGRYDPRANRSIAGLFADLARDMTGLVRTELEMAKTELSEKAGQAAGGAVFIAIGGFVAFAGLLVLLACVVLALTQVVAPWLAALIVGLVVAAIGVVLMLTGRSRLRPQNLQPNRTIETLRDDKRWAQGHLSR